jgi:PAS domain S-box-containing protein
VTSSNPSFCFYKEVLEHISDGVYFLDRNQRIQYWNEGAFTLTGYKAEEILGQYCPDYRICDADDRGGHRLRLCKEGCPLAASVDDKEPHEVRWFLQHKKGAASRLSCVRSPFARPTAQLLGR